MTKRLLSILLVLCMVMSLLPGTAWAAEVETSGTCGKDGDNLNWSYDSSTHTLTITGTGEMMDYHGIVYNGNTGGTDAPWYYWRHSISTIIIQEGVTSIGNRAFKNIHYFEDLTVMLPSSLKTIGECAFQSCPLKNITIPPNVTYIGSHAFQSSALKSIVIPNGVTSIESHTFCYCSKLASVVLPPSIERIESSAFFDFGAPTITIPQNVNYIGDAALSSSSLTEIVVDAGNDTFSSRDGILFSKDMSTLIRCPEGKSGTYTIPESVTNIESGAFRDCNKLTQISIPNTITDISSSAFYRCNLTNIVIPNSVISIGNGAFSECDKVTSIFIPRSVTTIGSWAFKPSSYDLSSPIYSADLYYEGSESEWQSISFGEHAISPNVTIHYGSTDPGGQGGVGETLENKTVSGVLRSGDGCRVLWQCSYQVGEDNQPRNGDIRIFTSSTDTVEEELYLYNENVETGFPYPWELEPYNIPKSAVTSLTIRGEAQKLLLIPAGAFQGYTNLKQASLTCVSTIDTGAFSGCAALQSVGFPNQTLKVIGREAFKGTDLGRVTLEESVTTIGEDAFAGCENIRIRCYENSAAHNYAREHHIPFELIRSDTSVREVTAKFYTWNDGAKDITLDWGFDLFGYNSKDYIDNLAKAGLALSAATENSSEAAEILLMGLGFTSVGSKNYEHSWNEIGNPGVSFGHREVNGKHYFAVAIRGTTDPEDVITDLYGFVNAAKNINISLNSFISGICRLNLDEIKSNSMFFITGHSLGGATANVLAKELSDSYGHSNVFCYAFAPPRPIDWATALANSGLYNNIFNIMNLGDSVTSLPPLWARYGRDITFHRWLLVEFNKNFEALTGRNFVIQNLFSEHDVAVYQAFLMTKQIGGVVRVIRSACPVDIEVYDSDGVLVGRVINNAVSDTESEKVFIRVENDEKYLYLFTEDNYTIKMVGTDEGTMTYSVQDIDMGNGDIVSSKTFENVLLAKDKQLLSNATDADISTIPLYVLGDDGTPEKEVLPDGNGTEVPITDPSRPTVPVNPDNMPPHSTGGYSSGGSTNTSHTIIISSGITGGTVTVSPKSAAKGVTVTLATSPNEGYKLDRLTVADASGNELELTKIGNGVYAFTMPGSRVTVDAVFTVVSPEKPEPPATPSIHASFTDVQPGAYYADAVAWAVEQGITAGTSTTTFSPDASCTRGQMVTFLWRASGSPAPRGSANPFTDVQLGAYYYDAVLWAAEQGITSGTSATAFSPNAIVSRGQAVTFLYRAAGSPAAVGSTSFGDVASGAYYTDAVQWAVSRGVTVGTRGTTFSPDSDCSRAQIATFLYRDRVN